MTRLGVELAFLAAYFRANFKAALEYRVAFWTNVVAMLLNDLMWIAFWVVFFTRFPQVRGYELRDVLTLWAVAGMGFGLATGIFGNCHRYAPLIAEGKLDFYLLLPRPPLFHLLVSRMSVNAWGDVLFGLGVYAAAVRPGPLELLAFLAVSAAVAVLMVGHASLASSLAFWLGNAEGLAMQINNALLIFGTYPTTLFSGVVRVVLFTAIPAGFIAYLPVRFLREWEPWQLAAVVGAAALYGLLAVCVFQLGLRRYESGNSLAMRA